jgi:hypothetical protein
MPTVVEEFGLARVDDLKYEYSHLMFAKSPKTEVSNNYKL